MKRMKRVIALVLSLMMALAMCVTAFAADTDAEKTTTLTIKGSANHTYTVYQLLKGDISSLSNGSGKLSNVSAGDNLNANGKTVDEIVSEFASAKNGTNAENAAIGNTAWSYVDSSNSYGEVVFGASDTTAKTIKVAPGYYVVKDSTSDTTSVSRYLVAVAGDTEMTPKTTTPEIDKNIVDTDLNEAVDKVNGTSKKTDTAAIGDVIEYEVTGTVPEWAGYDYYYYVVNDTMSVGLTLNDDTSKTADGSSNGFVVKVGDKTLTRDKDYYVYKDGQSFTLAFANIKAYAAGSAISIKYSATVNKDAVIGSDPNTNTASLTYSNNPNTSERKDKEPTTPGVPDSTVPTGKTTDYITKTYVTQVQLFKYTNDGETKKALAGAEFTLTGTNLNQVKITTGTKFVEATDGTYYKLTDGTYTTTPSTKDTASKYVSTTQKYKEVTFVDTKSESAGDTTVKATVDANGYLQFTGLQLGEYTLTETYTPEGYNTCSPIKFTVTAPYNNDATAVVGGTVTWTSDNSNVKYDTNKKAFYVEVLNTTGKVLPSTGGIGTTIFYVLGTVLVLGAAVLLITKKRMQNVR